MIIDSVRKDDEHKAVLRLVQDDGSIAMLTVSIPQGWKDETMHLTLVNTGGFEAKVRFTAADTEVIQYVGRK